MVGMAYDADGGEGVDHDPDEELRSAFLLLFILQRGFLCSLDIVSFLVLTEELGFFV
jgi:hypothetical protein